MDSGVYTSAVGLLAQFNTENTIADNLANLQTPGFKEHVTELQDFAQQLLTSQDGAAPAASTGEAVIGSLGTGPQIRSLGLDLAQGNPRYTGGSLDMMIVGNGFFSVQAGNKVLLTRNGSFHRAASGLLVTAEGYQVLNANHQPIKVPASGFSIDRDGTLRVGGVARGRLGLARVQVGQPLSEAGSGYYIGPGTLLPGYPLAGDAQGTAVLSGYLETANVDMTTQTSAMIAAQRAYQADSRMMQIQDDTLSLAANDLGKVGA